MPESPELASKLPLGDLIELMGENGGLEDFFRQIHQMAAEIEKTSDPVTKRRLVQELKDKLS